MIDKEKMFLQMGDNEPIPVTEIPEFEIKCEVYEMNGSGYQPKKSDMPIARPKSGSNAIKKRTFEIRELDICECCEFKDLQFYEATKYYADGHVFAVPDAYLKCSNYPLCKRAVRMMLER